MPQKKNNNMQVDFTFQEYLGFLAFLGIATMGFWLMIFLLTYVVPYWVFGAAIERFKENRAAKKAQNRNKQPKNSYVAKVYSYRGFTSVRAFVYLY